MNKFEVKDGTVFIEVVSKVLGCRTVLVDVEDWKRFDLGSRSVQIKKGYAFIERGGKRLFIHQLVLGVIPGYLIDHISRVKLDNRRSNLRHCRIQESNVNRGKPSHNKSGVVGVCWSSIYQKWIGQLKFDRKQNRRLFDKFEDAVEYRKALEKQFWGSFVHRPV